MFVSSGRIGKEYASVIGSVSGSHALIVSFSPGYNCSLRRVAWHALVSLSLSGSILGSGLEVARFLLPFFSP